MGLFKKKPTAFATVTINARLQPKIRDDFYEKTLAALFKKTKAGEIDGGGTLLSENGEPLESDVTFVYYPEYKNKLIEVIRMLPAPVGSRLTFDDSDEKYEFVTLEGMAVYLNGVDLDPEVYASCDVNEIAETLANSIDGLALFSHWHGNKETALYFYAPSFEAMKAATADFISTYPLCQKCHVEKIA